MDINYLSIADLHSGQAAVEKARISTRATPRAEAAARELAESFEAIFISQMLAPMFETVATDGPFGGGHSEQIYRSMQVEEVGNSIAATGGLGIADAVMRELIQAQGYQE